MAADTATDAAPAEASSTGHQASGSRSRPADEETPLLKGPEPPEDEPDREEVILPAEMSNKKLFLTLGSIYVGVFLAALDSVVIATLSAPISNSFHSLSLLSWLASSYFIANAACQPITGRLTDIFSRRAGLVVSNALFAVGNLMCGMAKSQWTMIAGRVVAGMGGGGLMAISTFVASDLVPLRKRGIVQGVGNLSYGVGAGLGGFFGGYVNDAWGWRYAFLAQVPACIASGLLVSWLVNVPPKRSEKSKLSRVDFTGSFTLVATLLLLLLGLNSGGNVVPWSHPLVLTTLPLSAVSLVIFLLWESRAKDPVIPVRLLLDRTVLASCFTNWFCSMVTFSCLFYLPIYFALSGSSTTESGIRLTPHTVGTSITSLGAGFVMRKTGTYKLLLMISMAVFVTSDGLFGTMKLDTSKWLPALYLFILGTGFGGMLTTTLIALIAAVDHKHQAVITSALYAFRSTGSTLGITICSAVYQNILRRELFARFGDEPGAREQIQRIRDSLEELDHLPPGWKPGVLDSLMDALRGVFLTGLAMSILAFISAAFIRQHVLHTNLERIEEDAACEE